VSKRKDIGVLVKTLKRVMEPIADKGSWKERKGKHLNIQCHYKGHHIKFTFPNSPSGGSAVKNSYAQVRRKLNECGLSDPRFSVKMITTSNDTDYLLDKLYELLDTQEQDNKFIREDVGESSSKRYIKEARRAQRGAVSKKKPYRKRITYPFSEDRRITYYRYYVWRTYFRRDDTEVEGFITSTKPVYDEALVMWKQRNI
jgi:hypothetical protein